ncbi:hypothetical protein PHJA_001154500 [Phtheirospermum japonicum]|uniref:Neprosin PEP catalytic domain-containing protein n=1 Tax=Phtheirospermum japonicum TaxID=374723 RepID=A0A830BQW5_9LAMI|nr:hypothetical protein PHJA_001154500 [Phtheirospermum japonicum]
MGRRKEGFSRSIVILILVPIIFIVFFSKKCLAISDSLNYTEYRQVSSLRLARIQRHLDKLNKLPVFTIESPDGDIIDCVHKKRQPALDHPLLKHHKIQKMNYYIQRIPTEIPKDMKKSKTNNTRSVDGLKGVWQMWHLKGQLCPKGTVPIRRSTMHDVLRAKSLYDFGKKQTRLSSPADRRGADTDSTNDDLSGNNHEHAIAYTTTSGDLYGAKASINVWDPPVERVSEFSLSQIWVLSGSFDGTDLNSVEAGWQVSPELYGDNSPRLFTYWTSDGYQSTGCYNLLCSGFVQTNSRIAIGAAISPVSTVDGNQYDITILIWKDPKTGHWWLAFGDNTLVGYWPSTLFTHLADRATMVEWGGEIVNSRPNHEHTSTQMGSGHFAEDGFGKASYFRNLQIVDSANNLGSAQHITTLAEFPNCYNIQSSYNDEWETHFYYGGPGRSSKCP